QALLKAIATTKRSAPGVRGDLNAGLEALRRPQRRRGLAVVIGDFLGEIDWARSLRAIGAHHELLGVEVLDPRDIELPLVGPVTLRDAESGEIVDIDVTAQVRADYAKAAAAHRTEVLRTFRTAGGPVLSLRSDRDWIADTVRFIGTRRRSMAAGAR
ncbi:MAG: DUF58 domain-containing protein, partial [Gordonia sp. (in: high G+C Gram-positive bacteria)]